MFSISRPNFPTTSRRLCDTHQPTFSTQAMRSEHAIRTSESPAARVMTNCSLTFPEPSSSTWEFIVPKQEEDIPTESVTAAQTCRGHIVSNLLSYLEILVDEDLV